MFRGEMETEIDLDINTVYKISKANTVKHIINLRPEVVVLEDSENFKKLKISDSTGGKKVTWILDVYFDDEKKIIKHVQSEGPLKGLEIYWHFKELSQNKTKITCVHEFYLKNFIILRNFFSKILYNIEMKPYIIKRFDMVKEDIEKESAYVSR